MGNNVKLYCVLLGILALSRVEKYSKGQRIISVFVGTKFVTCTLAKQQLHGHVCKFIWLCVHESMMWTPLKWFAKAGNFCSINTNLNVCRPVLQPSRKFTVEEYFNLKSIYISISLYTHTPMCLKLLSQRLLRQETVYLKLSVFSTVRKRLRWAWETLLQPHLTVIQETFVTR